MESFYEVLGVARTASVADIRKAYMTLARERHPDRFADPAEKARAQDAFQRATEAFNTLSSEKARAEYDRDLEKPKPTTPGEMAADAYARGVAELEASRIEAAIELLQQAAYLAPEVARYHAALGRALSRNPRSAREAVQALEQALKLAPSDARVMAELALVLERQGLRIRARRAAEMAARLAPGDSEVGRVVGPILERPRPDEGPGDKTVTRRRP